MRSPFVPIWPRKAALLISLVTVIFPGLSQCATTWVMGNGFALVHYDCSGDEIIITKDGKAIWSSLPSQPFLSASSGEDSITEDSGNFKIDMVDENRCQRQSIAKISHVPRSNSDNGFGVVIVGELSDCGTATTHVEYSAQFWVPGDLKDRVSFQFDIDPSPKSPKTEQPVRLFVIYKSQDNEDFYGLGAQATFGTLKQQSIPIFSREQGVGRGDEPTTEVEDLVGFFAGGNHVTTYTSIPQYISTDGNAFYLDKQSTAFANFDFTAADAVTVRYNGLSVQGQFFQASSILDAIGMVTDYTGKMPVLPDWVDTGAILGIQGGQDKVNKVVQQGLEVGCPIAAVWLQDWSGTRLQETPTGINISRLWWNWEPDSVLYPTWNEFVQQLRDSHNVRTLSYINPFFANVSSKPDGFKRNLFQEAVDHKYAIQNLTTGNVSIVSSGPGIDAGILDLTNADARQWFTNVLRNQVWNANISGFMCDFGEYTPITPDTGLYDRSLDPAVYHNVYPGAWAAFQQGVIEGLSETADSDAVVFHRSANLGSGSSMNLFWAGDQDIAWARNDGIKSVVPILGHMGMCGYSQTHSDIGGYTTAFDFPTAQNPTGAIGRSAELLGRWGELAAVSSAFFRSHEGNIPEINAQPYTNSSTYAYFSHNAGMFQALAPYRRHILNTECASKGWPLLRMPVIYHPEDPAVRNISYESFYLGPDLFVAPVLDPGVTESHTYLPGDDANSFRHVWSGQKFHGGQTITVQARFGQPPIFVVNNAETPELKSFLDFVSKEGNTIVSI